MLMKSQTDVLDQIVFFHWLHPLLTVDFYFDILSRSKTLIREKNYPSFPHGAELCWLTLFLPACLDDKNVILTLNKYFLELHKLGFVEG